MTDLIKVILVCALLIVVVIFAPLATIWSLNTLFGTAIAYNFWTWLAAIWLSSVTFGGVQAAVKAKG
jgi:hypothetical protein